MTHQQNRGFFTQYENYFSDKTMFVREKSFRSTKNARLSVDLSRKDCQNQTDNYNEYDFFKDDKMRLQDELKIKRHLTRPSINLFRRQKQSKWLELLANNKSIQGQRQKQQHHPIQLERSPLRINIYSNNKKKTISYHRSTSQGFKVEQKETSTVLQKKKHYNIKQRPSTCIKIQEKQKHFLFKEGTKKKEAKIEQKQINFQVRVKPINNLIVAKRKRTRQEIKKMYQPSKFFRNSKKKAEPMAQLSGSDLFKAWELTTQQLAGNQIQNYTQDLFQGHIQIQDSPIKISHRKIQSQRL